jgi:hypothetical protein
MPFKMTGCLETSCLVSIRGSSKEQMKNSTLDVDVPRDVVQPHFDTRKQHVTSGRQRHLGVFTRMVHARTRRRVVPNSLNLSTINSLYDQLEEMVLAVIRKEVIC